MLASALVQANNSRGSSAVQQDSAYSGVTRINIVIALGESILYRPVADNPISGIDCPLVDGGL